MFDIDKSLKKIIGKKPRVKRKGDWDGDGIPNWKDCQPFNIMRQDDITLYHGTNKYNADRIKQEGLRPHVSPHGERAVYLTANPYAAVYHAKRRTTQNYGARILPGARMKTKEEAKPVVLKVRVPEEVIQNRNLNRMRTHPINEVKIYQTIPTNKISRMQRDEVKEYLNPRNPFITTKSKYVKTTSSYLRTVADDEYDKRRGYNDNDKDGVVNYEDSDPEDYNKQ